MNLAEIIYNIHRYGHYIYEELRTHLEKSYKGFLSLFTFCFKETASFGSVQIKIN